MRWFLYFLFPPYGLYVMWFKKKVKWFIKWPVTILSFLILIVAVDHNLNPHRVEDSIAQDIIASTLKEDGEKAWLVERVGAFPYQSNTYILYEVYLDESMRYALMRYEKDSMVMDGLFQSKPTEEWMNQSSYDISLHPIVALALYQERSQFPKWEWKNEKIHSSEEVYDISLRSDREVVLTNISSHRSQSILIEPSLPHKIEKYFKKEEEELGKIMQVKKHEIGIGMDKFYIQTNKALYRVDRYENGTINLLLGEK